MQGLWQDLRVGLRLVVKTPTVAIVVTITLALGVCMNSVIFSAVNGILLRPLQVPNPQELVVLAIDEKNTPLGSLGFSYPEFVEVRDQSDSACDVFGQALAGFVSLDDGNRSERAGIAAVSSNYFSGLQLKPALGRLILPGEGETAGEEPVMVLGNRYWKSRFAGDRNIVGKKVRIDGELVTVVGVVPEEFHGSFSIFELDGYVPLSTISRDPAWSKIWTDRNLRMMLVSGRLRRGVSSKAFQSMVDVIMKRLSESYPATEKNLAIRVIPERSARPIPYANKPFVLMSILFLVLTAMVLLLACVNVINIIMARASARQGEMSIREALGATRPMLIRGMFGETIWLVLFGGIAGVVASLGASKFTNSIPLPNFPLHFDTSFDWRVFAYSLGIVIFTGIFVGIMPAVQATRSDVNTVLRHGSGAGGARGATQRVRRDLMVVQLSASLSLLVIAGLFVQSLRIAEHADLGFETDHLLTFAVDPAQRGYGRVQATEFYRELESRLRALPGVDAVAASSYLPLGDFPTKQPVYRERRGPGNEERSPNVLYSRVDNDYFAAMGIPLLRGRSFGFSDTENSPAVGIINQTMASRYWSNEDPIGKRFSIQSQDGPFIEVVGVMKDGKYQSVGEEPQPYFVIPLSQNYIPARTVLIRSNLPIESLIIDTRHQISAVAPDLSVTEVRTMKEALYGANGFYMFRLGAILASAMGLVALILAVVGVYGVVSYLTTRRTAEIGIRVALGASQLEIFRLVIREGMKLILLGLFLGAIAAFGLAKLISHLSFALAGNDLAIYVGAAAVLSAFALLACCVPAWRATRVSPVIALRYD
jgi:predicted permease